MNDIPNDSANGTITITRDFGTTGTDSLKGFILFKLIAYANFKQREWTIRNGKTGKTQSILLKRGQIVPDYSFFGTICRTSKSTISRNLQILAEDGELKIESVNGKNVVTVLKYEEYVCSKKTPISEPEQEPISNKEPEPEAESYDEFDSMFEMELKKETTPTPIRTIEAQTKMEPESIEEQEAFLREYGLDINGKPLKEKV